MIRLPETREIPPYAWVHPDERMAAAHRAGAIPPTAHRLMADVYAAFGEEILDVSKRT